MRSGWLALLLFVPVALAGEIRGTVEAPRGAIVRVLPLEPFEGRTATIGPWSSAQPEGVRPLHEEAFVAEVGEDASFSVELPEGRTHAHLRFEAPGAAPFTAETIPVGAALTITLDAGGPAFATTVDAASGRAAVGVGVIACDRGAFIFGEESCSVAVSDDGGIARFAHLPLGEVSFLATGSGWARRGWLRGAVVEPAEERPALALDFAMRPGFAVRGKTVDPQGRPIEGARVRAILNRPPRNEVKLPWFWPESSDRAGLFELEGLPDSGRVRVLATYPERRRAESEPMLTSEDVDGLRLVLARGATLRFELVDGQGAPVETTVAARLRKIADPSRGRSGPAFPVDTELIVPLGEGRYEMQRLRDGTFDVFLYPDRWAQVMVEDVALVEEGERDLGRFVVEKGSVIVGRVSDASGAPIAGAEVNGLTRPAEGGFRSRTTITDDDGNYELAGLLPAPASMEVSARGFVKAAREEVPTDGAPADFTLVEQGTLIGRVVDADGTAMTQFAIAPLRESDPDDVDRRRSGSAPEAFEDPEGAFRIGELEPASYTLRVYAGDHAATSLAGIVLDAGEELDVGTIELDRGVDIEGRVIDASTGEPVVGATIFAKSLLGGSRLYVGAGNADPTTKSDGEGAFALRGLESGRHELTAEHADYPRASLRIELSSELAPEPILVELEAGGTLIGTVRDRDGQVVEGATISLRSAERRGPSKSGVTDAEGRYRIERILPGAYFGQAALNSRSRRSAGRQVLIRAGEEHRLDFDATSRITLRGRVLRDEQPVQNAAISLSHGESSLVSGRIAATSSGAQGVYEIGLEEPGLYTVRVRTTDIGGFGTTLRIEVPDQEIFERDLLLPVGTITGRVIDESGVGKHEAYVQLELEGAEHGLFPEQFGLSDRAGAFSFSAVPPGRYRLRAGAEGYALAEAGPVELAEGGRIDDVELLLERADRISGRVTDRAGRPLQGAAVMATQPNVTVFSPGTTTTTDVSGRFHLALPYEQQVDLVAFADGWAPAILGGVSHASVPDDGVTLMLTEGATIRARLAAADGTPIAGARLQVEAIGHHPLYTSLMAVSSEKVTAADGTVTIRNLRAGPYRITLPTLPGVAPQVVQVGDDGVVELPLVAPPP